MSRGQQDNETEKLMTTDTAEKTEGTEMPEKYENKSKEDGKMVKLKII